MLNYFWKILDCCLFGCHVIVCMFCIMSNKKNKKNSVCSLLCSHIKKNIYVILVCILWH